MLMVGIRSSSKVLTLNIRSSILTVTDCFKLTHLKPAILIIYDIIIKHFTTHWVMVIVPYLKIRNDQL